MSGSVDKGRGLLGRFFGGSTPASGDDANKAGSVATPEPIEPTQVADAPALASDGATQKEGWFTRLKAGLTRTSSKLSEGITGLLTKRKLDADTLDELEDLLIRGGPRSNDRHAYHRGPGQRPLREGAFPGGRAGRAGAGGGAHTGSGRQAALARRKPQAARDPGGRCQRHRQDDDHRQAGSRCSATTAKK